MTTSATIRVAARELPMPPTPWHTDAGEIHRLARWLVRERRYDAGGLLEYFGKPWHYEAEREEMLAATTQD